MDLETEIRLINQRLDSIAKFIEDDRKEYKEHLITAQTFRDKVIRLEETVKGHGSEHIYYRWLFGIIITVGLALLVK